MNRTVPSPETASSPSAGTAPWRAGVSRICITPAESIWLAGFGGRTGSSTGVLEDIYARALALQDETGAISVILSTDLLGFSRSMADTLARRVQDQFGVPRERLVLNASHNHSAPVTSDLLRLYYDLAPEQDAAVERYSAWLMERLVEAIGASLQELQQVELAFGQGFAGFGVNRRRMRNTRALPGPVDHDVPVLSVRTASGSLLAVLFGYACHTTSSSGLQVHGDYAGFAATALEKLFPGATALFVTGCGGDINPIPRFRPGLSETFGMLLATSVRDVLEGGMQPVEGPLQVAFAEVDLKFADVPTRNQLEARLEGTEHIRRREIEYAIAILDRGEPLMTSAPFPIQAWKIGNGPLCIWLSGEPVVDYSLRFKASYGWDTTWVSGYSNELLAYIPSLRVLREGGYEGGDGMMEYGLPSPFSEDVEEIIAAGIDSLVRTVSSLPK